MILHHKVHFHYVVFLFHQTEDLLLILEFFLLNTHRIFYYNYLHGLTHDLPYQIATPLIPQQLVQLLKAATK